MRFFFLVLCISVILFSCNKQDVIRLKSPDGKNIFTVFPNSKTSNPGGIPFSVQYHNSKVILPSILQIESSEIDFSGKFKVVDVDETSLVNEWSSNFSELSLIPDNYNQLKLYLESSSAKLNIICRAYNEGLAFSYEIPEQNNISEIGLDEKITYNFEEDYFVWSTPKREKGVLTAQGDYRKIHLSEIEIGCERPLVVEISDSVLIALAEAKLVDYARLSFNAGENSKNSIVSTLDGKMGKQVQDTITGAIISERIDGTKVHMKLPFQSPWRVIMVGKGPAELLTNNYLIQNLNDPCQIEDISWIKPGKLLRETTLTTKGGYAAIDFVASHNMQYVLFDAGWYGNEMDDSSDATTITLDPKRSKGPFDIEAVSAYAKAKNVGIILYVNRRSLEKQLDEVLALFKKWGIAGVKYGFVRVGDQDATAWLHEAIKKAAKYELVIDVHDEYRPTGFSRTYPNFLTQEGIKGDETTVTNKHTLITMFTRMLAGAADNTICYYNKRVNTMGSHASQLAKAVCIFSPLQAVYWYDKPSASPKKLDGLWGDTRHIGNEPELEFFDNVPTTWDATKVLEAEIGEIGVIARRKGKDWFIGGINGDSARNLNLNFSFLNKGEKYLAKIYTDDKSINTRTHVKISEMNIDENSILPILLKENNGFAMHLIQQ